MRTRWCFRGMRDFIRFPIRATHTGEDVGVEEAEMEASCLLSFLIPIHTFFPSTSLGTFHFIINFSYLRPHLSISPLLLIAFNYLHFLFALFIIIPSPLLFSTLFQFRKLSVLLLRTISNCFLGIRDLQV